MLEERVHAFAAAVHDVQYAFGQPGLLQQSGDLDGCERDLLAGLQHEGVAAGDGHRIHPERHHAGEVERRDAGADAQRLANGLAINAARDVLQRFAHQERRHAARELDHLDAALHVAAGLDERLAMLPRVALDQVLGILLQQRLEPEEDARAVGRRGFPPGGEGSRGGFDGLIHVFGRAEGSFSDDFAGGRVVDGGGGEVGETAPFAADPDRANS